MLGRAGYGVLLPYELLIPANTCQSSNLARRFDFPLFSLGRRSTVERFDDAKNPKKDEWSY